MRRRGLWVLCGLLGLLVLAGPARAANTLETVERTGDPDNRIDLVVMAEGYTPAEATQFRLHADTLLGGLFATAPWSAYRGAFNLYRIVTESNESGADHPSQGIYVDTYLDATYDYLGVERLLVVNEGQAVAAAVELLPEVDLVVVLVNDEQYGGSGGSVATVSATEVAVEILTHELGHSFGRLADEYTDPFPGYPPGDDEPNVDFDFALDQLKWSAWVTPATPLPTLEASALGDYLPVGAYEGARYLETGIYRPAPSCMMRSLEFDYCAVCREALVLAIHDQVEVIDDATPAPGIVRLDLGDPTSLPARFAVLTPRLWDATGLAVTWYLNDVEVATGTSVALGRAELGEQSAWHDLRCEVSDPTPWVRRDPASTLTTARYWYIDQSAAPVQADAGVVVDASGTDGGSRRGCRCDAATESVTLPVWLLLLGLWLASRRRACRTR